MSEIKLTRDNVKLRELTQPALLSQPSSFARRVNNVHSFVIGQASLNAKIIEQYEAIMQRLDALESGEVAPPQGLSVPLSPDSLTKRAQSRESRHSRSNSIP